MPSGSSVAIPFPPGYRASGVLLHVTSLPSPYGVGDLGPQAYAWVDQLSRAGQRWWQVLPLGPAGNGSSPYQSPSTFALSLDLVSPDQMVADGFLMKSDIPPTGFRQGPAQYDDAARFKGHLLDKAFDRFCGNPTHPRHREFEGFAHEHAWWLEDYALYMALCQRHPNMSYRHWPGGLGRREPGALAAARRELAGEMARIRFAQFVVYRQWTALRNFARDRRVGLIGDLPIFVAPDSADVWASPELFLLDSDCWPSELAGVPPDYFSPTGQLWGNPLYNWEAHRLTGYAWWLQRIKGVLEQVDLIRIDHFRGFEAAWHVARDAASAAEGEWKPGPGEDFFRHAKAALGGLPFIAEDLGHITAPVRALRDAFELPGMRVLQFAFDGLPDNPFAPHLYPHNSVAYTGTHDNNTVQGWFGEIETWQRDAVWRYIQHYVAPQDMAWKFIEMVANSQAALAIFPLQDLLNLGAEARMNVPGIAEGNWGWRYTPEMPVAAALERLRQMTERSGRWRS